MDHNDAAAMVEGIEGKGGLRELAAARNEAQHDLSACLIDLDLSPRVSPMGQVAYPRGCNPGGELRDNVNAGVIGDTYHIETREGQTG